jgi:hypothetical protein
MFIYCNDKEIYEDGTIIYKKENISFENYDVIEENNIIKLKPKKKIIIIDNINKLSEFNLNNSVIIECYINNKRPTKNKYASILNDIYILIDNGTKIIKNSLLNIKTTNDNEKGFTYNLQLGISVQRTDANKTLKEIVNQCLINKYLLNIEIKLNNGKNIILNV